MEDFEHGVDKDEILIALIEERVLLYDKSSSDFKDNQKKKEAWNEIASRMLELTENPTEVKLIISRWKSLKKKFVEERRKIGEYIPSGSAAPGVTSEWKYFQIMKFLEKHIQHRQTSSNFNLPVEMNVEESSDDDDGDDEDLINDEETETSEEDEDFTNCTEDSGRPATTPATRVQEINNFLLIFRDAWDKVPNKNKKKCFFKLREAIRNKKEDSVPPNH